MICFWLGPLGVRPDGERQMLTRKQFELLRFIHERLTEAEFFTPN